METLEKEAVVLDTFDGHLFLLCKSHYRSSRTNFFDSIRRLWAVRCALPLDKVDKRIDEYIADRLVNIIERIHGKLDMRSIHSQIGFDLTQPENSTIFETLIWKYRRILMNTKVKDNGIQLVSYPEVQKRIINGLLHIKQSDFENINELDLYNRLTKLDKR